MSRPRPRRSAPRPNYPRVLGLGVAVVIVACGGRVDSEASTSHPASGTGGTRADSGTSVGGSASHATGGSSNGTGGSLGETGGDWGGGQPTGAGASGWYDDDASLGGSSGASDDAAPSDDAGPSDDAAPSDDAGAD